VARKRGSGRARPAPQKAPATGDFCPNCSASLTELDRFCPACGTILPGGEEE